MNMVVTTENGWTFEFEDHQVLVFDKNAQPIMQLPKFPADACPAIVLAWRIGESRGQVNALDALEKAWKDGK